MTELSSRPEPDDDVALHEERPSAPVPVPAQARAPDRPAEADPAPGPDAAPPPAVDREAWLLASRMEQLHRSVRTLHGLVQRAPGPASPVVAVAPRLPRRAASATPEPPRALPAHPWWPDRPLPPAPLTPPPGLESYALGPLAVPTVGVCVVGLRGADLEAAVRQVADRQRRTQDFKPVFLSDSPDTGPVARAGYVVEHVSRREAAGDADDLGLPPARRAFAARKWGFAEILDLRDVRAEPSPALLVVPSVAAAPVPIPAAPAKVRRGRAAVISWDLGHNPAGRAMVLHDLLARDWDVELVGPLWSRFGGAVWRPIAGGARKVRSFGCETLEQFWPAALALAATAEYDLVVVCKPRLPALILGALIKKACGCPLVLDVDDLELSFFGDPSPVSLDALEAAGPEALREPYGELATRAGDSLVRDADAVTVSNAALRSRFGGTVVRHARDEEAFRPARFDREAERARMGMAPDDFALVFVGTVRAHKGVFTVAETLAALPDKRFVLHLIGDIPDRRVRAEIDRHAGARVVVHPGCDFDDLPARIAAADAVVLLQDPAHPVSQFQIPAKVSDASAFGLPILATDVPPLRDLAAQGVVRTVAPADLGPALLALLAERETGEAARARARVREGFEAELGLEVNRTRLGFAVARARDAGPGLPPSFERLIDLAGRAYAGLRAAHRPAAAASTPPLPPMPAVARAPLDLVMFWKQNDSGLYGRRSDMLMAHLLASGRVRRVLQFDAPVPVADLARWAEAGPGTPAGLIAANVIDNQSGARDGESHLLRTFLWHRRGGGGLLPGAGTSLADYPDYVAAQMARAGIRAEEALAWVCPVVFDFPAVARRIPFRGIVGDLIDDQRGFAMSPAYRQRVEESYRATLPLLDLAFTNCAPLAEAFADLVPDIRVIPNGAERPTDEAGPVPQALARLPRPVAGYVGNLRDRFDWALLRETALRLPGVTFAIVGGGAREPDLEQVRGVPNIVLTGVIPYREVAACIRAFDVALVPHTRDALTSRMNPLKIYNYFMAGRPIVATEVDNVDAAIRPFIRFASDPDRFAAAIGDALGSPPPSGPECEAVREGITWESRARAVMAAIDGWLAETGR